MRNRCGELLQLKWRNQCNQAPESTINGINWNTYEWHRTIYVGKTRLVWGNVAELIEASRNQWNQQEHERLFFILQLNSWEFFFFVFVHFRTRLVADFVLKYLLDKPWPSRQAVVTGIFLLLPGARHRCGVVFYLDYTGTKLMVRCAGKRRSSF